MRAGTKRQRDRDAREGVLVDARHSPSAPSGSRLSCAMWVDGREDVLAVGVEVIAASVNLWPAVKRRQLPAAGE